jgi:hypothetical protein
MGLNETVAQSTGDATDDSDTVKLKKVIAELIYGFT